MPMGGYPGYPGQPQMGGQYPGMGAPQGAGMFGGYAPPPGNPAVQQARFDKLGVGGEPGGAANNLEILLDVPLQVTVELGRTSRTVREVLELGAGSVVELDKLAGESVELLVNNKLIAKGEVVVIDENFGIRITSIVSPKERLESLK
ncbi:MAG: flagellar motor switch protein FliN [Candidatus Wallbacteria bacterium HGW-Wallbacteria-1]|jgi:flagellar motor switch protein FliN/FliY|uniref:Flagellar motor switch protein FliN n=1 Tax=Candidatus Wallbacteria bacterium HGW-Wallbacteria-1 TaxID=2013854 RepID=A0A2N1PTB4_9BACT|nr:MAG: flagellar motor switch protein FliN [Candidatus Wallbacteria bacterium HGW-Wallbacteria-1]